jgi:hypothetical protein
MNISRKLTCGVAAILVLLSTAAPADARGRHRDRDDIDAGDVVGAAVVLGGIALIASAFKKDGYGGSYGAERKAIKACVREAERGGSDDDMTRVRDITDVERRDGYYLVRGVLETRDDEQDGFSCTARGSRIYDFQRSSGYHW